MACGCKKNKNGGKCTGPNCPKPTATVTSAGTTVTTTATTRKVTRGGTALPKFIKK